MPSQCNREKTRKNLTLILDRVHNGANLEQLAEYRRLFKKGIPLFSRSWASAYLLMLLDRGQLRLDRIDNRMQRGENRRQKGNRDSAAPENRETGRAQPDSKQYPLPDEESKLLFISAGRNRRLFPREILGIINSTTAIPKEDIGAIRILDNYSFVQVRDTVADRIIEALNGLNFRGRPLAVNYAKSRDDEANEPEVFDDAGLEADTSTDAEDET